MVNLDGAKYIPVGGVGTVTIVPTSQDRGKEMHQDQDATKTNRGPARRKKTNSSSIMRGGREALGSHVGFGTE
jgi:hypothetical protein